MTPSTQVVIMSDQQRVAVATNAAHLKILEWLYPDKFEKLKSRFPILEHPDEIAQSEKDAKKINDFIKKLGIRSSDDFFMKFAD